MRWFEKNKRVAESLGLRDLGGLDLVFNRNREPIRGNMHIVCGKRLRVGKIISTAELCYWCPNCEVIVERGL